MLTNQVHHHYSTRNTHVDKVQDSLAAPPYHPVGISAVPTSANVQSEDRTFVGFPEVDLAAVRLRQDAPLALWYIARVQDKPGKGLVPLSSMKEYGPRGTLRRVLTKGEGTFWVVAGDKLFLRSATAVARCLGIKRLTTLYRAQAHSLTGKQIRGWLTLNAFAVFRKRRPISVLTIAEAAGVTERTVYRWLNATGWPRRMNIAIHDSLSDEGTLGLARRNAERPGAWWVLHGKDGKTYLTRRLPNSLLEQSERTRGGERLRRLNRTLSCGVKRRGQRRRVQSGVRRSSPYVQAGACIRIAVWLPSASTLEHPAYITPDIFEHHPEQTRRWGQARSTNGQQEAPVVAQIRRRLALVEDIRRLSPGRMWKTYRQSPMRWPAC